MAIRINANGFNNPSKGYMTTRASIPANNYGGACFNRGKNVYLIGGNSGAGYVTTHRVYDSLTDTWSTLAAITTGLLQMGFWATATDVYTFGGYNGTTRDYVYKWVSDSWSAPTTLPAARHAMGVVKIGSYYWLFGGASGGSFATGYKTVWKYDGSTTWVSSGLTDMPAERAAFACHAVGNYVYAIGGISSGSTAYNTVWRYDTVNNTWATNFTSAPVTYIAQAGSVIIGTKIYMFGSSTATAGIAQSLIYDTVKDKWEMLPDLPVVRRVSGTAFDDDEIHLLGGYGSSAASATHWNFRV